jgi:predicted DNA-binding transcriptional regulator AlpA
MGTMRRPELSDEMNQARDLDDELSELLVTARRAATMCGKSLRTWRTWDSAGLIPQPVRIGRSTLWRFAELKAWVAAGCPRRAEWEGRQ